MVYPFVVFFQGLLVMTLYGNYMITGEKRIQLSRLCLQPTILVEDAVVLYATIDGSFDSPQNSSGYDSQGYCRATFATNDLNVTGFLVVVSNKLPTHRKSCSAWNVLLRLQDYKQTVKVGCTRFISQYFSRALSISFLPVALHQLLLVYSRHQKLPIEETFTITITAVHYNCQRRRSYDPSLWWPCPKSPEICIHPGLKCDRENNCGIWEDEMGCTDGMFATPEPTLPPRTAESSDDWTIKGGIGTVPTPAGSTVGVGMVLSFFLFLGFISIFCCGFICWWRYKAFVSERKFLEYAQTYNTFPRHERRGRRRVDSNMDMTAAVSAKRSNGRPRSDREMRILREAAMSDNPRTSGRRNTTSESGPNFMQKAANRLGFKSSTANNNNQDYFDEELAF